MNRDRDAFGPIWRDPVDTLTDRFFNWLAAHPRRLGALIVGGVLLAAILEAPH